ncbi:FAD-dependent oxidoreductase [Streptomyces sp. NPDC049954]|uniref:NAD(P)/FAD-dependent oxidoreductase n=1 Tax=Streptomyces sp. NPDC049954 TaxID=3155779 RepID=UPI00343F785B
MKNILVIGGGFAGVWSAAGAVRAARLHAAATAGPQAGPAEEIRVTLVSAGDDLVIRPRLYEADPESKRVALDRVLGPIGVRRVAATVTGIDTEARSVTALSRGGESLSLPYDRLVLATGSQTARPRFPGAEDVFDVDTMGAAAALDHHVRRLSEQAGRDGQFTAVVVGAGFTGLEVATELTGRLAEFAPDGQAVRVVLVERADELGPELGATPRPHITEVVDGLGIEQRLGTTVERYEDGVVHLADGETIPASTVIWTAGMAASPLTAHIPGERDRMGRLEVDAFLRVVGAPEVYAAGDTAAAVAGEGHFVTQSCQHAVPLGKFAGHNVAADLLGTDPVPFAPAPYVTCLDLGPAGAVLTAGWDRVVQLTGQDAKQLKQQINTEWIYPPVDDAEAILGLADHRTIWPTDEAA